MNLYLRYFDNETLVDNADEALAFLRSIGEINVTRDLEADLRDYAASDQNFPKRYKVRSHVYFIVIKTTAANMQDFKDKKAVKGGKGAQGKDRGGDNLQQLYEERAGWYEGEIDFKRVVLVPGTGKHEYRDTKFVADVKALSGIDCYNRIVEYLRDRVDPRSQFPSVKGKKFRAQYLGMWK